MAMHVQGFLKRGQFYRTLIFLQEEHFHALFY